MNTTDVIGGAATPPSPFPDNILWDFADIDRKRLRHWSDMFVRPRGVIRHGASDTTPQITPNDQEIEVSGLRLEVKPLLGEVPLGAPVRIDIKLTNITENPIAAPRDISLKSPCMTGFVQGPTGQVRTFRPLTRCHDSIETTVLEAGECINGSMTLLRGAQGALSPPPVCRR